MSQSNSATNFTVQWGRSRTKEKEGFPITNGSMEFLLSISQSDVDSVGGFFSTR